MDIANIAGNALGSAASSGSSLMDLFGPNSDLMSMLGSEGMKNLISGGTALWQGMETKDMLDFQKGLAQNAQAKTDTLFQQDQEDRQRRKDLNFS